MDGYDNRSYGEAFADVYDEWYGDISDVGTTVAALAALAAAAAPFPLLELGVGTGRLAIPLARRVAPTRVIGLDSSPAMLARLDANQAAAEHRVEPVLGDMVDGLPDGPFAVVFVAFNTFFNLGSGQRQSACLAGLASRLAPGGCVVVEAFVPGDESTGATSVEVRTIAADRVVLSVARYGDDNRAEGQFIELTESGGVRLRPWSIRYVAPEALDAMAAAAELVLIERWEAFDATPFTDASQRHVSIYGRRPLGDG